MTESGWVGPGMTLLCQTLGDLQFAHTLGKILLKDDERGQSQTVRNCTVQTPCCSFRMDKVQFPFASAPACTDSRRCHIHSVTIAFICFHFSLAWPMTWNVWNVTLLGFNQADTSARYCLCRQIVHAIGNVSCQSDTGCLPSKAFADTDQPTTWDRENRKPSWSPPAGYCSEPFWIYYSLHLPCMPLLCQYAQRRMKTLDGASKLCRFRSSAYVEGGVVPKS